MSCSALKMKGGEGMNTRKTVIELPCEVGSSVWIWVKLVADHSELVECRVENFLVTDSMKVLANLKRLRPKGFDSTYTIAAEDFSKYVVFEKEDAKALFRKNIKERPKEKSFPSVSG